MKKVFISGCFDQLHCGHIEFIRKASQLGKLYIGVCNDANLEMLKNRKPVFTQEERLFLLKSLKYTHKAWINKGFGMLDFQDEVEKLRPDILYVNSDGGSQVKKDLCNSLGIEYVVDERIPHFGLPVRSTTSLREKITIPHRIELSGAWLDQPHISALHGGPVITLCIEPSPYYNSDGCGLANSTRMNAIQLWGDRIPINMDKYKLSKILFAYDNFPGANNYINGSQDSIGIVFPGVNRLVYGQGKYWPEEIQSVRDKNILNWLEKHLFIRKVSPRPLDYAPVVDQSINNQKVKRLAEYSDHVWESIVKMDLKGMGKNMTKAYQAQCDLFENLITPGLQSAINDVKDSVLGWKVPGAGGGGFLVVFAEKKPAGFHSLKIKR